MTSSDRNLFDELSRWARRNISKAFASAAAFSPKAGEVFGPGFGPGPMSKRKWGWDGFRMDLGTPSVQTNENFKIGLRLVSSSCGMLVANVFRIFLAECLSDPARFRTPWSRHIPLAAGCAARAVQQRPQLRVGGPLKNHQTPVVFSMLETAWLLLSYIYIYENNWKYMKKNVCWKI